MEMPDRGSRGKANTAFPPLPPSLEIAKAIPTFPHDGGGSTALSHPKPKPVRYLLPKQPGRSSMCHPTSRSKVSTITPVAQGPADDAHRRDEPPRRSVPAPTKPGSHRPDSGWLVPTSSRRPRASLSPAGLARSRSSAPPAPWLVANAPLQRAFDHARGTIGIAGSTFGNEKDLIPAADEALANPALAVAVTLGRIDVGDTPGAAREWLCPTCHKPGSGCHSQRQIGRAHV